MSQEKAGNVIWLASRRTLREKVREIRTPDKRQYDPTDIIP